MSGTFCCIDYHTNTENSAWETLQFEHIDINATQNITTCLHCIGVSKYTGMYSIHGK